MAALEVSGVRGGKTLIERHLLVPAVRDLGERRIEQLAQRCDDVGQRIGKVLVFATAESMPRHDHARAIDRIVIVARRDRSAFVSAEQRARRGAAELLELGARCSPNRARRRGRRHHLVVDFAGFSTTGHGDPPSSEHMARHDSARNHPISVQDRHCERSEAIPAL